MALFELMMLLANLLLRVAFRVMLVFVVLFLIGGLYPYVAQVMGVPYLTVWDLGVHIVAGIRHLTDTVVPATY